MDHFQNSGHDPMEGYFTNHGHEGELSSPVSMADQQFPRDAHDPPPSRVLGVPEYRAAPNRTGPHYDYDAQYPPDKPGEEAGDNARVWRIYMDEADVYDDDMIRGFRDTIDSLLVFAALFSAVVTTFLVQTSSALLPDYAQITSYLMAEQNMLLRAGGNLTLIGAVPMSRYDPSSTTFEVSDIVVNALFSASLTLSLSITLFSVLIKQWLQSYTTLTSGTAKDRALIRNFRFMGLTRWKLPEMISLLPLMLHASLGIFAAGLCVFAQQRHYIVFGIVLGIFSMSALTYLVLLILPAYSADCPYRIPLLETPLWYLRVYVSSFWSLRGVLWGQAKAWVASPQLTTGPLSLGDDGPSVDIEASRDSELNAAFNSFGNMCSAIAWLYQVSSNPPVRAAAAQSLAEILPGPSTSHFMERRESITTKSQDVNDIRPLAQISHLLFKTLWEGIAKVEYVPENVDVRELVHPNSKLYNPLIRAEAMLHSWVSYCSGSSFSANEAFSDVEKTSRIAPLDRYPALLGASQRGETPLVRYLLECKYRWDWSSCGWLPEGMDYFHLRAVRDSLLPDAASGGHAEIVQLLIENGIDPNVPRNDQSKHTPLFLAISNGHFDVVRVLYGASVVSFTEEETIRCGTPLTLACRYGWTDIAEFLLEMPGTNINECSNALGTPLICAARYWSGTDMIQLLIDRGADLHIQFRGQTAFEVALEQGRIDKAEWLARAGGGKILKNWMYPKL
ncbi:hypothetical protein DL96DRAFT_1613736 [Flagelloscypha sp. PMI_526]|nr:hypothetical protein DL96DRAFT_1613736 [Flagelloscypha sp. PMI_526]